MSRQMAQAAAEHGAWSGSSGLEGLGRGSRVWFARGVHTWSGGAVLAVAADAWTIRADEGDDVVVPTNRIQPANPAVMEVRMRGGDREVTTSPPLFGPGLVWPGRRGASESEPLLRPSLLPLPLSVLRT